MNQSTAVLAVLASLLVMGFALGPHRSEAASQSASQDPPALPGTYSLVSIDGHPLPYAPVHPATPAGAPPPPVVAGSILTISADSTFTLSMSYRMTRQGAEQVFDRTFTGTYVWEGSGYRFMWVNAGQTPVTLRGDTLVLNNEGMLFAYHRQRSR